MKRRIEQDAGSDDVRMNEILRRINAAIDVRFGGEIDHGIKRMLDHELIHQVNIRDVGLEEFVTIAILLRDAIQVREVPGVSQYVHIGYRRRLVMLQNITNKVAPDETTATRYKNAHCSAY